MLLFLACATPPPEAEPSVSEEAPVSPTPWVYDEPRAEAHRLTPEELEQAVDEVAATLLRIDPMRVHDAFEATNAFADAECPIRYPHNGQTVVSGDCTAASGYTWLGYALLSRVYGRPVATEEGMYFHHVFGWSTGLLRVLGPDGSTLEVLGDDLFREYDGADGARILEMYLWGDFYAEGSALAEGWLGEGLGAQLYLDAETRGTGTVAVWEGGLSRLDGIGKAAVLHALSFDTTVCPSEPTGSIDLYDTEGAWYTVTFDGAAACDGCGAATHEDGAAIGTVCADLTALGSWEERPW